MGTVFDSELQPGETLLWQGQPDPSVLFTKADIFLIPFSLMWFAFAIFWEFSVVTFVPRNQGGDPSGFFFVLWGIPFLLIGAYFVFGRFVFKAWQKRRTFYAVTNQRVFSVMGVSKKNVRTMYINAIPSLNKSVNAAGNGTVEFGSVSPLLSMYGNSGLGWFGALNLAGLTGGMAFYDIRDANKVYDLVAKLRGA